VGFNGKIWDESTLIFQAEIITKGTFSSLNAHTEEQPTLLTEAPLNSRSHRDQTAEIFFVTF
jgi:actin-related protein